jgi:hypothetical protein
VLFIKEHPGESFEIASDIATLSVLGPQGLAAKQIVTTSIKTSVKQIAPHISRWIAKRNGVEKLSQRPIGKIIEHGTTKPIEVINPIKVTGGKNLSPQKVQTNTKITDFGVNYKNFETTKWTAPNGTKQTYKVHQRNDIDWGLVRTKGDQRFIGKTNKEAALAGHRPQLENGHFATTHHIGQNSKGPVVEASTEFHDFSNPKAFKSIHNQHGKSKPHPDFPVDQSIWNKEQKEYWKWRVKNVE